MHATPEIKTRSRVKFEIVIVKDTELEYWNKIVQHISRQLHLNADVVCRRRPQSPVIALGIESAESFVSQNYGSVVRGLENLLVKGEQATNRCRKPRNRRGSNVVKVNRGWFQIDLKLLIEVSGHRLETSLCCVERTALSGLISDSERLARTTA